MKLQPIHLISQKAKKSFHSFVCNFVFGILPHQTRYCNVNNICIQRIDSKCIFQVPGRMGMLVILFLILITIHGSVDGPSSRGFSYLEVWYTGMFMPVVIAIIEYAFILAVLKYRSESQYNTEKLFRNREMRRLLAHIGYLIAKTHFWEQHCSSSYRNMTILQDLNMRGAQGRITKVQTKRVF